MLILTKSIFRIHVIDYVPISIFKTHSKLFNELKSYEFPFSTISRKLNPESKLVCVSEHTVTAGKGILWKNIIH